jgi:hypothetical protein
LEGIEDARPGFHGDDNDLIYVTRSGRIWLVERPDERPDVLRELAELPKGVEFWPDRFPREFEELYLARIQAVGGATWMDWPAQIEGFASGAIPCHALASCRKPVPIGGWRAEATDAG